MYDELQKLKNNEFSNKKCLNKNNDLNYYQLSIIFLIISIMIIFTIYKIHYIILINKIYTIDGRSNIINNLNSKEYDIKKYMNQYNKEIIEKYINIKSYSKNLEDLILNTFFYDINNGFYIDIGEFESNDNSATKYFYLKGWNGINVKPLNDEYKYLIEERPNDINLNYYIVEKIHKKYYFQHYNNTNITFHKISDILNEYIPKNKEIHFCKIDMKEDIRKILLGYNFEKHSPKIFCIEANDTGLYNYQSFEYILNKNNYTFAYKYDTSRYYIDNQLYSLKEKVKLLDIIVQTYKNKYYL